MDKPSGNHSTGNPLNPDDPRFTPTLARMVGQLLTRREYRAPADAVRAELAYGDFVFVLALLVQAFEGKDLGAFAQIARLYGTQDAMAKARLMEMDRLAQQAARQRVTIDVFNAAIDEISKPIADLDNPTEDPLP